jgi:hypothetical protein
VDPQYSLSALDLKDYPDYWYVDGGGFRLVRMLRTPLVA